MQRVTVLVVDDNDGARKTLAGLLRLDGFEPLTAATGRDGIALALAERVDVIVLDVQLPDISGIDVARQLRQRGIHAPIVIVTVFPDLDTSSEASALDASYMEGFYLFEDLREVIIDTLRRSSAGGSPKTATSAVASDTTCTFRRPLPHDQRLRRVVRAIEAEPERAWSLSALAALVRLSESRLRHLFASCVGVPLSHFIRNRRILRVAQQLGSSCESLQSIAERMGLPRDPRVVRRQFHERFGMLPRAYRRRYARPPSDL